MFIRTALSVGLFLACVGAQNQFADYDYQDTLSDRQQQNQFRQAAPSRQEPPRGAFGQGRLTQTTTRTPPVAILKQINRQNDDGSYTYGYEGGDGSFKIETKLVTGEVMGKYGYVDESGKLRTVEYGANRYGFQPAGEGITVPPPTLVDETTRKGPNGEIIQYQEEGTYFEPEPVRPAPRPKASRPRPQHVPQAQPQYDDAYVAPAARPRPTASAGPVPPRAMIPGAAPVHAAPQPQSAPRHSFNFAPQPSAFSDQSRPSAFSDQSRPSAFSDQPRPRPAPVREQPRNRNNGVLDQLQQQFALPPNSGTPLHDISFGSYSSQTQF